MASVDLGPWWRIWAWVWWLPAVGEAIGGWVVTGRLVVGALRGASGWAGAVAMGQVALALYNRAARRWRPLTWFQEGAAVAHVDTRTALSAGFFPAVAFGVGTGGAVGAGWGYAGGGWPLWIGGGALAAVAAWAGTLVLYNRIVVPFARPLDWEEEEQGGWRRITRLDPHRARLTGAMLVFAWVVVWLLAGVLWLWIRLDFFSPGLPPGYFRLGVAVFTGFLWAALGFLLAVGLGAWCYVGALWYNRWAARGGGVRWRSRQRQVGAS
ncbi:MAG: hypothetical protein K6U14_03250 [Firmicutes bacterium]|nr:hypothetical protein [Alicyclobacillaceae bacterium]MCL6496635.1 hypothetical protein [Bacillota bacterium]